MSEGGRPLRVGVNLLWLVPGVVGGSEEYTVRLLEGLADLGAPDLDVTLYALDDLGTAHPGLLARFPVRTLGLHGRMKPLRIAAESTWLPRQMRRDGIEVALHGGGVVPPVPGAPAVVLTIHDLQPLDLPENFSRAKVAYLRAMLPRSARRADAITTVSRTAGQRIVDRLGVPGAKVHPVLHGLGPEHLGPVAEAEVARVRSTYGLADRWLLYPVITYPHKDHATLIAAFAGLAEDHPDVDLVLTGGEGPAEADVRAAIGASGVAARIHRTGRVPRADLDALLAGAVAVPFPSRYEGFGNGALEALARGTPVVAADDTSLPEVVGTGGLLVEPGNVAGWTAALVRILDDDALRGELAAAGRAHAATFTPEAAARSLAEALRAAAGREDPAADSGPGVVAG